MAIAKPFIRVELDPAQPVQEICDVISAILPYYPGKEADILLKVRSAIDERLEGGEADANN